MNMNEDEYVYFFLFCLRSSESVPGEVDSEIVGVTSTSSLSVWNRFEVSPSTSWSVSHPASRTLSPRSPALDRPWLPPCFDEDSGDVDRVTLPRAARRSASSLPVNSPPSSTLNVCLNFCAGRNVRAFYYVALHMVQSAVLSSSGVCPSVYQSVCLFLTLMCRGHIGRVNWKLITRVLA